MELKKRDYRLKSQKDFSYVFKNGKRVYSKTLSLIYANSLNGLKVGFAVGKKHGGSVRRNYIKRILRESFRSFMPFLQQNFFFVIIPKVLDDYSLNEYKKEMLYLFKKSGLLNCENNEIFKC